MKILFFIGEFSEGGAERVISILANNLVKRNYDVEILKYYKSVNFYSTDKRVKITSIEENTNTINKFVNLKWIKNYFKNNADIVISFLAVFNMYALVANLGNNIPIVVADRNDPRYMPKNCLLRSLRNLLYKKANAVVVQTNSNKEYFSKYINNNCYVINNPINMNDYLGKALKTTKDNLIVSVGRLEIQKNQTILIEAFKEIVDKHSDYKLVIYGEGSYRKELENKIKELNLYNCVSLPGNEKDIFNKICSAKAFVLCSNYEGMPNALMEAMCLGLPCISTKVSGATDIIKNNENGILIDVSNKDQLVDAIETITNNEDIANRMASNAVLISSNFDEDYICNKWLEVINNI